MKESRTYYVYTRGVNGIVTTLVEGKTHIISNHKDWPLLTILDKGTVATFKEWIYFKIE